MNSLSNLSGWATMIGLQFENLVLSNKKNIHRILKLDYDSIEIEGSFFQTQTIKTKGCQIDYLIQTKTSTLYVCEVKFSRNEIKSDIINEMKNKLSALSVPKGFSCLPVLIHVNGVHDKVIDSNYFFKIIDFSELLNN